MEVKDLTGAQVENDLCFSFFLVMFFSFTETLVIVIYMLLDLCFEFLFFTS